MTSTVLDRLPNTAGILTNLGNFYTFVRELAFQGIGSALGWRCRRKQGRR